MQLVGAGGLTSEVEFQVPLPLQWDYREYRYRDPAFNLLCWQPAEWCSPHTLYFQYNTSKRPVWSTSRSHGSPAKVYPVTAEASQFAVPFPLIPRDFSKFFILILRAVHKLMAHSVSLTDE